MAVPVMQYIPDTPLPQDNFRVIGTSKDAPTSYTDRILHFEVWRLVSSFKSSSTQKSETSDQRVDLLTKRWQEEVAHQLSPAFRLLDPDTT
jgi:hypothetical protein